MTDDSQRIFEKYTKRSNSHLDANHTPLNGEQAEDFGCFGWLRGIRDRAIMLELRKKDGHCLAIGYNWIERVEFEPENGITLHLPNRTVRITGSGLNSEVRPTIRLYDGIVRHRVPWLRESDRGEQLQPHTTSIVIDSIQWATMSEE